MDEPFMRSLWVKGRDLAEYLEDELEASKPSKLIISRIEKELPEPQARFFASLFLMQAAAATTTEGDGSDGKCQREDVIREIFLNTDFVTWCPRPDTDFDGFQDIENKYYYLYWVMRAVDARLANILHRNDHPMTRLSFEGERGRRSFFHLIKWAITEGRANGVRMILSQQPVATLLSLDDIEKLLAISEMHSYGSSVFECKKALLESIPIDWLANFKFSLGESMTRSWEEVVRQNISNKTFNAIKTEMSCLSLDQQVDFFEILTAGHNPTPGTIDWLLCFIEMNAKTSTFRQDKSIDYMINSRVEAVTSVLFAKTSNKVLRQKIQDLLLDEGNFSSLIQLIALSTANHQTELVETVLNHSSISDDNKELMLTHLNAEAIASLRTTANTSVKLFGEPINWGHIEAVAFHAKALKSVSSKDNFELLETLGRGAFGIVYNARLIRSPESGSGWYLWRIKPKQIIPELELAVKIVRHGIEKENMELLKTLQHSNIVRYFHGFSQAQDCFEDFYIIMECCDSDLSKELDHRHEKMSIHSVNVLANQMSKATRYLEAKRVIHRDIKPANILVKWKPNAKSENPQYKLADFGCMKNLGDTKRRMASIQTMSRVGTISYMAPELFMERRLLTTNPALSRKYLVRYSAMADSWSFGIVFLHCLTGELPYLEEVREKIATVDDDGLRNVLIPLLQEDPLNRKYLHEVYNLKSK